PAPKWDRPSQPRDSNAGQQRSRPVFPQPPIGSKQPAPPTIPSPIYRGGSGLPINGAGSPPLGVEPAVPVLGPEHDNQSSAHFSDRGSHNRGGGGPNIIVSPDSFSGPRLHGLVPNITVESDHHSHHHRDNHNVPIYTPYPVYTG